MNFYVKTLYRTAAITNGCTIFALPTMVRQLWYKKDNGLIQ
ncbi:hypothetical protein [Desulfobacula sp.]|nr:hypothetical protein [Desulfobacula sp.]